MDGRGEVASRRLRDPKRAGDLDDHDVGIGDGAEVDEDDAVPVMIEPARSNLQRQPGLTRAAGTGERQHTRVVEQTADLEDLPGPSHERGPQRRKVGPPPFEGAQRREFRRQPVHDQIVQMFRVFDVFHPVGAQVAGGHTLRQPVGQQRPGDVGQHHLFPVPGRGDAGSSVDVDADVVVPARGPLRRCACPSSRGCDGRRAIRTTRAAAAPSRHCVRPRSR